MKRLLSTGLFLTLLLFSAPLWAADEKAHEFSYPNIRALEVDGGIFDVEVERSRNGYVTMRAENVPEGIEVRHYKRGSGLEVEVTGKTVFRGFNNIQRGTLYFTVPDDLEIKISGSIGDINIRNIAADELFVVSSVGDVHLENMAASPDVTTSTGEVNLEVILGNPEIQTSTGDITCTDITGNLDTNSSTGHHFLTRIEGDINAESTAGHITLSHVQGQLRLRTTVGRQEGTDVLLTEDSSFRTSVGNIRFDFLNDLDDLSFDLSATTGRLTVGDNYSGKNLRLTGGSIKVTGKSSTGSQDYR